MDATASDPRSCVAAVTYPALGGFTGGATVTSPFAGVTFRSTYSWSNNTASASPDQQPLAATNGAGASASTATAFSMVKDAAGPSGGSVDATGLGATGGRYSTSTTLRGDMVGHHVGLRGGRVGDPDEGVGAVDTADTVAACT